MPIARLRPSAPECSCSPTPRRRELSAAPPSIWEPSRRYAASPASTVFRGGRPGRACFSPARLYAPTHSPTPPLPPLRGVAGVYSFSWWQAGPRLLLTGLTLRTDDETYTGRGATQDDGRMVILLTSGAKEMRMSGTLAKLKVE